MALRKFTAKVLSDGHLSLPDDIAGENGKEFEVVLAPKEDIYAYAEKLAAEKGFLHYSESDVEKIIHESRNIQ